MGLFITAFVLLGTTINLIIEAKYVFIVPPLAVLTFFNFKLALKKLKSEPKLEKDSNTWNRMLFASITFCLGAFLIIMGIVALGPKSSEGEVLSMLFFALAAPHKPFQNDTTSASPSF